MSENSRFPLIRGIDQRSAPLRQDLTISNLSGKVAVITGGSSGTGLSSAKRLAAEGAHVFITGRRESELDKAAAEIGQGATAAQGDVSSLDDLDRLFAQVRAEKGIIDIIVTSAGLVEADDRHRDARTFRQNLQSQCTPRVLHRVEGPPPHDPRRCDRLISSCLNVKGRPAHSTYNASKAAVRSFARTWAAELKNRGIRVNSLSPGTIDTPLIDGATGAKEQATTPANSLRR